MRHRHAFLLRQHDRSTFLRRSLMIRRILLLTLALAAACDPSRALTPIPGDVSVQRQVWDRQEIDDYRFSFARYCHCSPLELVRVEVRDGEIVEVREADSGRRLPQEAWVGTPTVDELFDRIAQAQATGEHNQASYHPTLGYPMAAVIGQLALDAGVAYRLHDLRPLD
jgi:Family of unknown function (DUF6174)